MTRYVIDAPTLVHLVANGVQVSSARLEKQHQERLTELKMRLLGDWITDRVDVGSHIRVYTRI
jgi:hypothetical protein